jgi:hypothetical protein
MSLPLGPQEREELEYAQQYGGEEKFMSDLVEYGKLTGKAWVDALLAFDPVSQSLIRFHKEVVIPFLKDAYKNRAKS